MTVFLALSCAPAPEKKEPAWQRFPLRGEVVGLRAGDTNIADVAHEDIDGFMGAMTMGYPVPDADEFAKLSVGARIEATVMAQSHSEYYLDEIRVLPADKPEAQEKEQE